MMYTPSTEQWSVVPGANTYKIAHAHAFVRGSGNFAIAGGEFGQTDYSEWIYT